MQLRLGFSGPNAPQRLEIEVAGLMVHCQPADGDLDLAAAYLSGCGIALTPDHQRKLLFTSRQLPRLVDLPEHVDVVGVGAARVLLTLLRTPPPLGDAVKLTIEDSEFVNLSWVVGGLTLNEPLELNLVPALTSLGVPLIASDLTWEALSGHVHVPVTPVRARSNLDGFIELSCAATGRLEMAEIPGLFRLGPALFGVPAAFVEHLGGIPGLVWDTPVPTYDRPPRARPRSSFPLSPDAERGLGEVVHALASTRSQAVVWGAGSGRRPACLAALESLTAFPALLVVAPWGLWSWQRTLDMAGRTWSTQEGDADVRLVTYEQMATLPRIPSPAAILFDDLDVAAALTPELVQASRRLDGLVDTYRVACCRTLPEDPDILMRFMAAVRPAEFRTDMPAVVRYPGDSRARLLEHASCYVSELVRESSVPFRRRSRVEALPCPEPLRELLQGLVTGHEADVLVRTATELGTQSWISPKLVTAVSLAREARSRGKRVALLARSADTARALASMLGPAGCQVVSVREPDGDIVAVAGEQWPDVSDYDMVVFVGYPGSFSELESAVGSASTEVGPEEVVLLHLQGTPDDPAALAGLRELEWSRRGSP